MSKTIEITDEQVEAIKKGIQEAWERDFKPYLEAISKTIRISSPCGPWWI